MNPMLEQTDEQLYTAWAAGDDDAGRRLIGRRLDGTRRFVRALLTGPEYEDVVQEVFVRLAQRARDGGSITNVRSFIAGIACNVVREQLRTRARVEEVGERSIADPRTNHSGVMVRFEDRRLLLKALHRLPIEDQILLGLRYWERLGTRELAEILGANHSTVRTRLQRAEAKLRRLIAALAKSAEARVSTTGSLTEWGHGVCTRVGEQ